MSFLFRPFFVFVFSIFFFVANAYADSPLSIKTSRNMWGSTNFYIEAYDNNIIVTDIDINKGRCVVLKEELLKRGDIRREFSPEGGVTGTNYPQTDKYKRLKREGMVTEDDLIFCYFYDLGFHPRNCDSSGLGRKVAEVYYYKSKVFPYRLDFGDTKLLRYEGDCNVLRIDVDTQSHGSWTFSFR